MILFAPFVCHYTSITITSTPRVHVVTVKLLVWSREKISGRQAPFRAQKPLNGAHSDSKLLASATLCLPLSVSVPMTFVGIQGRYIWFKKSGSRFTKSGSRFLQNPCELGATSEKKWLPVPNLLFFALGMIPKRFNFNIWNYVSYRFLARCATPGYPHPIRTPWFSYSCGWGTPVISTITTSCISHQRTQPICAVTGKRDVKSLPYRVVQM